MTDTRLDTYVVIQLTDVRGTLCHAYLGRRGKSVDPEKRATGARDWLPFLTKDVEIFRSAQEAADAAGTWGGGYVDAHLAKRFEDVNKDDWQQLLPSDHPGREL